MLFVGFSSDSRYSIISLMYSYRCILLRFSSSTALCKIYFSEVTCLRILFIRSFRLFLTVFDNVKYNGNEYLFHPHNPLLGQCSLWMTFGRFFSLLIPNSMAVDSQHDKTTFFFIHSVSTEIFILRTQEPNGH